MSPSQKENQNEQTYFRLFAERGCHPGRADTGRRAGPGCTKTGCFEQDLCQEDQQDASQQEVDCSEEHQRHTRFEVSGEA